MRRRLQLAPIELLECVLVRHRGVAESGTCIADIGGPVHLVEAVEVLSLGPRWIAGRDVDDGAPAGSLERLAEREPIARGKLVVALLTVDPQSGLQRGVREPAD